MSRDTEGRASWRGVAVVLAGLALLVGGCGGGGSGDVNSPQPKPSVEYSPLSLGDLLVYVDQDQVFRRHIATRLENVRGKEATVITVYELSPNDVGSYEQFWSFQGNALQRLAPPNADPFSLELGDIDYAHFPLQEGASFVSVNKTLNDSFDQDGDGRPETWTLWSEVKVLGLETLTTPAGTFVNTAHVRTTERYTLTLSSKGPQATETGIWDDWYAPGIGRVQSSYEDGSGSDKRSGWTKLAAYSIKGRRSAEAAPRVTAVTPLPGNAQGLSADVTVTFARDLDPRSILPSLVTVTNASGVEVPGDVSYRNQQLRLTTFMPNWPTGTYTIKIRAGMTDLIGNPLPAQSHTFRIGAGG